MNRRRFAGAALAGLGGFLFPRNLFAGVIPDVPDFLSTEKVIYRILGYPQYGCSIFLKQPRKCSITGKSTLFYCDYLWGLDYSRSGFLFGNKNTDGNKWWFGVDNIDCIFVCHEQDKPWRLYEHIGSDRWLIYKDGFSRRGEVRK